MWWSDPEPRRKSGLPTSKKKGDSVCVAAACRYAVACPSSGDLEKEEEEEEEAPEDGVWDVEEEIVDVMVTSSELVEGTTFLRPEKLVIVSSTKVRNRRDLAPLTEGFTPAELSLRVWLGLLARTAYSLKSCCSTSKAFLFFLLVAAAS